MITKNGNPEYLLCVRTDIAAPSGDGIIVLGRTTSYISSLRDLDDTIMAIRRDGYIKHPQKDGYIMASAIREVFINEQ